MVAQRVREEKQLFCDQQDQQRRLDRQARDEACMQALLRYEAAAEEKRAPESGEGKLVKLRERERNQALRGRQDRQGQVGGQGQFPRAIGRRLAATEVEERQAIWDDQERAYYRDREQRDDAGARAL